MVLFPSDILRRGTEGWGMATVVNSLAGITADRVRDSLEKILKSRPFHQSETLTRFLRYVVEHALGKSGEKLKEYTLGVDVFGRGAEFDPRFDSIVRVEASRLRSRLAEYYAAEGKNDRVRIELPKGTYIPVFHTVAPVARPMRMRRLRRAIWVGLVACVCGMAALAAIRALQTANPPPSIAVLPFVNLSGDHDADYLSDGITEEITNVLARIPGLRVAARSSAFRFRGGSADVHDVGRQLGVGTVLEGSVRRADGKLRVAARLINTADGYSLWSATYDREETDALGIQADIADAIARNLQLRMPGMTGRNAKERRVQSATAHDLVMQARYLPADSPESEERLKSYQRALEADIGYAPAYAGVADEWIKRSLEGWIAPRDAMENARAAIAKALRIDDTLPDAHLLWAMLKWTYEWDWRGARQQFERTLELNPNDANARMQYARYLALMGDRQGATTQLDQIRVLDPLSPAARGVEAAVYYLLRDYDRTIQHAQAVLAGEPELWLMYYWMGRAYDSKGQLRDACDALEKWRSIPGRMQGAGFGMLGSVYARAGRRAEALELLEEAKERAKQAHVSPSSVALVYAGLGEHTQAMEWLERAYQERDHSLVAIKADPAYDSLRNEPEFNSLLTKMKLN